MAPIPRSEPRGPMDETTKTECRDLAMALADAARGETLRYFRQRDLGADNKRAEGFDPVTEGDRAAEAVMRDLIETRRPDDGILGEEFPPKQSTSGLTWVLDPIDGTRGYISGTPTWGTLIALHNGTKPVFGVIDQPYIDERFWGGFGAAEVCGPRGTVSLATSSVKSLDDAIIFTTFPEVGSSDEAAGFTGPAARQIRAGAFWLRPTLTFTTRPSRSSRTSHDRDPHSKCRCRGHNGRCPSRDEIR